MNKPKKMALSKHRKNRIKRKKKLRESEALAKVKVSKKVEKKVPPVKETKPDTKEKTLEV